MKGSILGDLHGQLGGLALEVEGLGGVAGVAGGALHDGDVVVAGIVGEGDHALGIGGGGHLAAFVVAHLDGGALNGIAVLVLDGDGVGDLGGGSLGGC